MNSTPYQDHPPCVIAAKLADTKVYACSPSTMHRILRENKQNAHRRRSKRPEYGTRIETVARQPNQVWCWDITYLPTRIVGVYFKLYAMIDIFSRKIVGHLVAENENDLHGRDVIERAIDAEGVNAMHLRIHNDNGRPMKSFTLVEWLKVIGVLQSCSRPRVSNDNPQIESFFKTMKYDSRYTNVPFTNLDHARSWVDDFVAWYNNEHMHSGINYVTPSQRHTGADVLVLARRAEVQMQAWKNKPIRWSKPPKAWMRAEAVELSAAGCRMMK